MISNRNDISHFQSTVLPELTIEFRIIWPFCSGKEVSNKFQRWPAYIPIGKILVIFDPQFTPIIPIKFEVNLPLNLGEEIQNKFS